MFPASTKGGGVEMAFPDTCKTPSPSGPVAVPYPNGTYEVQNSASKSPVKSTLSGSNVSLSYSYGNEAGTPKGVVSSITMGKFVGNAALLKYLVDKAHGKGFKVMIEVKAEGKANIRLVPSQQRVIIMAGSNPVPSINAAARTYFASSGTEGMEWLLRRLG